MFPHIVWRNGLPEGRGSLLPGSLTLAAQLPELVSGEVLLDHAAIQEDARTEPASRAPQRAQLGSSPVEFLSQCTEQFGVR